MGLLLCDLDDTILSRRENFWVWASAYVTGHALAAREIDWIVELDQDGYRPRDEFFTILSQRHDLGYSAQEITERYFADFLSALETIDALARARRAGFKVAIVTNGAQRAQEAKVSSAGLAELVDAVCISEVVGYAKPHREIFEVAAERCAASLKGAWMVGDNPLSDMEGARSCEAKTVWLPNGRTWPSELEFRPDLEAGSFAGAVDLVLSSER